MIGLEGGVECVPLRFSWSQVCPPGCQALVNDLYEDCDGVTTPDGFYFDPDSAIGGAWSKKVNNLHDVLCQRS